MIVIEQLLKVTSILRGLEVWGFLLFLVNLDGSCL